MKKVMNQSTMTKMLNFGSVFLMVVAAILFIGSAAKSNKIDKENDNRYYLVENANRFMNASAKLTSEVRQFAATGEEQYYNNYMKEVNQIQDRETGISKMKEIGLTSEENSMVEEMLSLSNQLVPLEEDAMAKVKEGATEEAMNYVFGAEYAGTLAKIKQLQSDFMRSLDKRSTKAVEDLKAEAKVFQMIAISFMVIIAVIQVISFMVINKKLLKPLGVIEHEMAEISKGNLSNPMVLEADTSEIGMLVYSMGKTKGTLNKYIKDISAQLEKMSKGDMRVSVDIDYIGDFEPIKIAIEKISASLRETLTQIQDAAEQVLAGANQVSIGAQTLAQGSTEQASTLEELSTAFVEVTDQVKRNAGYSKEAEDMVMGHRRLLKEAIRRCRA